MAGTPVLSRVDSTVDFKWYRGAPTSDAVARGELPLDKALDNDNYSARWTGILTPPATGDYELTVSWRRRLPAVHRRQAGDRSVDDDVAGSCRFGNA